MLLPLKVLEDSEVVALSSPEVCESPSELILSDVFSVEVTEEVADEFCQSEFTISDLGLVSVCTLQGSAFGSNTLSRALYVAFAFSRIWFFLAGNSRCLCSPVAFSLSLVVSVQPCMMDD